MSNMIISIIIMKFIKQGAEYVRLHGEAVVGGSVDDDGTVL